MAGDAGAFQTYFHVMLENGIYLAPSAFEAGFVSAAHGPEEIQLTLDAAEKAFHHIKKSA
jgi:glutamate-1-semialdehyde 2,1-aminomutase